MWFVKNNYILGVTVEMHTRLSVFVFYDTAYALRFKETGCGEKNYQHLQNLFFLNDCPSDSDEMMIYLNL